MKNKFVIAGISGGLFLLLLVMVRTFDVAAIGPEGTEVGCSHLNRWVHELFGENIFWYDFTEWLGIAAIIVGCAFAAIGLFQLIKRKSLFKVDTEILMLGALFLVLIGIYVFFEIVIVNYRPIIMPGFEHPEASFPSSHTMLVCVIMGSAAMLLEKYLSNEKLIKVLQTICFLMIFMMVLGRLLSGVHWFTDLAAGLLISISLLALYSGMIDNLRKHKAAGKHSMVQ